MKNIYANFLIAFVCFMAGAAEAAVCTSLSAGDWNVVGRWSCGHIPVAADTVVIAHNAVRMRGSYTVAGLTINAGAKLDDNGSNLTVNGNVVINGQLGNNNGGALRMRTAGATLSGTGFINDITIEIDAANITLSAGSTLDFDPNAEIDVGANVTPASLTINGTVTATTQAVGDRVIRVSSGGALTIGTTGTVNAPNSRLDVRTNASLLNNGTINVSALRGRTGAPVPVITQGASSSLTVSSASCDAANPCSFDASATGNTVTFNGTSVPITPVSTYYNLAGTGVTCPHGFVVLGSNPCPAGGPVSVTASPTLCVNDAAIGTQVWATPANAYTSNNIYAMAGPAVVTSGTYLTNYLKCTGYGFAIPAGATINGIVVNLERRLSSVTSTTGKDNDLKLVNAASAIVGTNHATVTAYTAADVIEAHGTSADTWTAGLTVADINSANFGAVYSGSITKTSISTTRRIRIDHMPITVTYTVVAAPHHIQIDHDGSGQTCRSETLTVTACANAACTAPHFSAATVTGSVTWSGTPGGTLPFTISSGGTGQTTVLLPVTTAQTVTLGTSTVSPTQSNPPSTCVNAGGGTACNLVFSSSSACFDAVEQGALSSATALYTKLSGTAFNLDVLAASNYTGTLTVELVDASSGSCLTYASLSSQSTTFTSQMRKTLGFNYANAAKNVKVRVTGLAASSCSSGRLALRPQSLTVTSNVNAHPAGSSVSATPTIKAGASFTLTATSPVTGYDGTPKVDNTKIAAHSGAVANGSVSGLFGAAAPATGIASGSSFSYDEVGYFRADALGVYDDTFTAIDSAAGDCTNDFSNTLVGGKYGCKFGNTAASAYFGRFIPDHFEVTQTAVSYHSSLCNAGLLISDGVTVCDATFNYMDEQMEANFTLSAATTAGNVTQNYNGGYAKLNPLATNNTLQWVAVNATVPTPTNLTARLDTSLVAASGSGSFASGIANMVVPLDINRLVLPDTPDGPYAALDIGIAPVDSDSVTTVFDLDANADATMDHTQVNTDPVEVRYGRLSVSNTHGSENSRLPVLVSAHFFSGGEWPSSSTDNVTTFNTATDLSVVIIKPPLATVTAYNAGSITLTAGAVSFSLNKPGVSGSANIGLTAPSYLLPAETGRATFGVYKGANQFIYMREAY